MCRPWVASGLDWVSLGALVGAVRIMSSVVACVLGRSPSAAVRLGWESALVAVGLEFSFALGWSWRLVWSWV